MCLGNLRAGAKRCPNTLHIVHNSGHPQHPTPAWQTAWQAQAHTAEEGRCSMHASPGDGQATRAKPARCRTPHVTMLSCGGKGEIGFTPHATIEHFWIPRKGCNSHKNSGLGSAEKGKLLFHSPLCTAGGSFLPGPAFFLFKDVTSSWRGIPGNSESKSSREDLHAHTHSRIPHL